MPAINVVGKALENHPQLIASLTQPVAGIIPSRSGVPRACC